jgi:predicted secreted hydrolase
VRNHLPVCLCLLAILVTGVCHAGPQFEAAVPGKIFEFPRDHGKHPEFQTEWWYFTGNLVSKDQRAWGFQLTFFRRGLARNQQDRRSAWTVRDLYPAHFAITDVKDGRFSHGELLVREGPGLAEASADSLSVRVKDWSAEMRDGEIHLRARKGKSALDLRLKPAKPLVLHGEAGFSRKGDREDQASYYYSFTRLKASGTLVFDGISHGVRGTAWMDHEFGSAIVKEDQSGWDWFSIQMDDGTELMVFYMRRKNGRPERTFGTFVGTDGRAVDLVGSRIDVSAIGTWKSPRTKTIYPSGWSMKIPRLGINLRVTPLIKDQELISEGSTGIVYWEGAVRVDGSRGKKKVSGRGYVELTGYAHSMSGRL